MTRLRPVYNQPPTVATLLEGDSCEEVHRCTDRIHPPDWHDPERRSGVRAGRERLGRQLLGRRRPPRRVIITTSGARRAPAARAAAPRAESVTLLRLGAVRSVCRSSPVRTATAALTGSSFTPRLDPAPRAPPPPASPRPQSLQTLDAARFSAGTQRRSASWMRDRRIPRPQPARRRLVRILAQIANDAARAGRQPRGAHVPAVQQQ